MHYYEHAPPTLPIFEMRGYCGRRCRWWWTCKCNSDQDGQEGEKGKSGEHDGNFRCDCGVLILFLLSYVIMSAGSIIEPDLISVSNQAMPRAIISPSVLASDFGQLTAECERMIKNGAEWLHMGKKLPPIIWISHCQNPDVMDGCNILAKSLIFYSNSRISVAILFQT